MKLTLILFILMTQDFFAQDFFRKEITQTEFKNVTFGQAVQSLQRKSQDLDKNRLGFNYVFTPEAAKQLDKKINLSLSVIALHEALKYSALLADIEVRYEGNTAIFLRSKEKLKNPVIMEKFVKRDQQFLNSLGVQCKKVEAANLTLNEVLELIKKQTLESGANRKSINLLNLAGSNESLKLTLSFNNISAYHILRYTSIAAGISMKIDRNAVVLQKSSK